MTQDNRRFEERFSLDLQAKVSFYDEGNKKNTELTTAANISASGAYLSTALKRPLASRIFIEFLVDFDDLKKLRFILSLESLKMKKDEKIWVKATGIVIRSEKNGLVILFEEDYQLSPMECYQKEEKS